MRKLGRKTDHRLSLLRGQVTFLLEKGRLETTATRAKEVQSLAEKMITLGKKNTLASRRQALSFITKEDVVKKLFDEIAPSFEGMQVSAGNVIVTAIKQQVEGNGLILRCYEAEDRDTDCTIKLFDTSFSFRIPHSGVKTFLIKDGKATETDFVE